MAYTSSQPLTFEEFLTQYGDNPRYELINGKLRDMSHESVTNRAVKFMVDG